MKKVKEKALALKSLNMFVKLKDSMEGIQCKMKFSQCVQENGSDENRKR